ncbi:50S ribosomal protein L32 [Thermincola ferriacetica]|uniref:Large ribosomal subunit protein bL32 n=2 Tax=Thermincola TaxID=278993 RepID=D5X8P9_THEPJ|nr:MULTISPECIES: 50S ribosomal protein L32 [Thermincola]ADG82925.1 ribosomal protein L32 [Thermincola potens JR]KNZ69596.1 50S ribosomal protein L32 [Thermincola ferriacetica]
MGVQQHRQSKSRVRKRRATQKLTAPGFISCPQCHEPKLPHRVCPECGYYKDKEVVAAESK